MKINFNAKLVKYSGDSSWHFISVPKEYWDDIKIITSEVSRGFGSVKVEATIGKSTWNTSIFPDIKTNTFFLPVKKEIRQKNNISDGDTAKVTLKILQ